MARDYWNESKKQSRAFKLVNFCRKDEHGKTIKIAMVVMTQEEATAVAMNTEREVNSYFKKYEMEIPRKGQASTGYEILNEQKASIEILYKVCRNPDDIKLPFFKNPMDMMSSLTTEEVGYLMKLYGQVKSQLSPLTYNASDEEFEAYLDRITVEDSVYAVSDLSAATLGEFIAYLVKKVKNNKSK